MGRCGCRRVHERHQAEARGTRSAVRVAAAGVEERLQGRRRSRPASRRRWRRPSLRGGTGPRSAANARCTAAAGATSGTSNAWRRCQNCRASRRGVGVGPRQGPCRRRRYCLRPPGDRARVASRTRRRRARRPRLPANRPRARTFVHGAVGGLHRLGRHDERDFLHDGAWARAALRCGQGRRRRPLAGAALIHVGIGAVADEHVPRRRPCGR